MEVRHVAVVNQSEQLAAGDVEKATAAVQQQVTGDFGPVWGVTATVALFSSLERLPNGSWPVVIRDEIGINQPGAHVSTDGQKPFALVLFTGKKWTITLSHEILELLVDPFGKTRLIGPSPREGEGDVEYLAEICDPCQSDDCAYLVNGDQLVSDFVFPSFYKGFGQGRYSQMGFVTDARQVLAGGYLTWHDLATDEWWQEFDDGAGTDFRQIDAALLRPDIHLRGAVDRVTAKAVARAKKAVRNPLLARTQKRNQQRIEQHAEVAKARARWWQEQIDRAARAAPEPAPAEPRPRRARRPKT